MKAYFEELAAYNMWANKKLIEWLEQLSESQWKQEVVSSFPSIRDTALHIAAAEKAWTERIQKIENVIWLPSVFQGSEKDLIEIWKVASGKLTELIGEITESELTEDIYFKRLNGDLHHLKTSECFAHTFNHSTYHRGQLVTMLRQVGFTNISSIDLLQFYREKQ